MLWILPDISNSKLWMVETKFVLSPAWKHIKAFSVILAVVEKQQIAISNFTGKDVYRSWSFLCSFFFWIFKFSDFVVSCYGD